MSCLLCVWCKLFLWLNFIIISWASSLVSKIFQEKLENFEILVSQHAEDRVMTARITHKHPTGLDPSAKPLESRLILVTARAAVILTNEIEPGHGKRWLVQAYDLFVKKVATLSYLAAPLANVEKIELFKVGFFEQFCKAKTARRTICFQVMAVRASAKCQWAVHIIYYQYANLNYEPCTILHIDFGVCILFCILMPHIYAR